MSNLDAFAKPYEPAQIEERMRSFWSTGNFYRAERDPSRKPYTIVIPPPNVTGDLHMGHMLNNTLQDLLIRWNRASGKVACWIPGTDHASIATEAKVTATLVKKGINKKEIGRDAFLEHAWDWANTYRGRIVGLLQALGISCDWKREAFTMDPSYSRAVIASFVKLYKDGLVYRGHRLVNWCPVSQSVISDEEVIGEERNSHLWHIRYPVVGEEGRFVVVATTRPETLLGDLAVAVNPKDERYAGIVGKQVVVPICGRAIPVIADSYVEKDFGSGVVKITPAHDPNDFEVGARHNLGLLNIMNPDASLNENVPDAYRGLDRFVARKKIVAELEAAGLMEKIEPYRHTVGISERGAVPIEYYLSKQWYIKMQPLAELALDATRSGRLKLVPAYQEKVWEHWLGNIKDWCVSRQLWWGHRIPIYYCESCSHIHCEEAAPTKCEKCGHTALKQDEDVLDTWASSWLWPFAVHAWPYGNAEQQKDLDYFYPTDIIVTGTDIIFFWIARMVMAGEYFMKKTPFHHVYFNPIVRDEKGRKMSKSLGNSPDIFNIIGTYGTDAMRFSMINQLVKGSDIAWEDESCEVGKHFCNKLWNAARFLLMNADKLGVDVNAVRSDALAARLQSGDPLVRWIVSEFGDVVRRAHVAVEGYEFGQYSAALYEFAWMIFCDWFVELMKPRMADGADAAVARETVTVALEVFEGMLRLLHPLMPYVTEEIWQHAFVGTSAGAPRTIGHQPLSKPNAESVDESAIRYMREVQTVVSAVRQVRGQYSIHPGQELSVVVKTDAARFGNLIPMMEFLAKAKFIFGGDRPKFAAVSVANGIDVFVDLAGLVDVAAERTRVQKRMEKVEQAIAGTEKRLSNTEFVGSAPAHIVEGARKQLEANQKELALLRESLALLSS